LLSRLGLIPLGADPRLFEYPPKGRPDDEVSDQDTLRYELKVTCSMNPQAPKNSRLPEDMYRNSKGISLDLLLNFQLLIIMIILAMCILLLNYNGICK